MRTTLTAIVIGVLAFFAAGFVAYTFLGNTVGPIITTQEPITTFVPDSKQKEILPPVVSPKAVVTTKAIAPKPLVTKSSVKYVTPKTVIAPGPLRVVTTAPVSPATTLTASGVILLTNVARAQNGGLPALSENQTLDRDAQMKVADMFSKQYFEHISPIGVGPGELADVVGYAYVLVGENLALGDFTGDQDLVTAWMNSPGHRANILNSHYQEIGVAVGKGIYEGRNTWLAVQSFGMPRSSCPAIDSKLKVQIEASNTTITNLRAQLDAKKAQIDATLQSDPNYNTYANEFNTLVPQYNAIVEINRVNVENYNAMIRAYNDCIIAANPHT